MHVIKSVKVLSVAKIMGAVYGAIGFVTGALSAFLYNLFAKWVGGIEVQVQAVDATRVMG